MLAKSDFPVAEALELLAKYEAETALLVPTPTGLDKSIFDATDGLRTYLREREYHDYATQQQEPGHKVVRDGFLVKATSLEKTRVSMYRPSTKNGDPRIWLGHPVRAYASAYNLLALMVIDHDLFILNMSDPEVRRSLNDTGSPFRRLLDASTGPSVVALELLEKLRAISQRGFVKTLRAGDTGVGFTP